jgi:hypothetical protein
VFRVALCDHLRGLDVGGVGGDDHGDDGQLVSAVRASGGAVGGPNGVVNVVGGVNGVGDVVGAPLATPLVRLRACQSAARQRGEQCWWLAACYWPARGCSRS